VSDWSWTCQTTDSCWNKFNKFYQQCGLFNNNDSLQSVDRVEFSNFAYGSDLYQKKYTALGGKDTRTPRMTNPHQRLKIYYDDT
jgi:hypothetical protein